MAKKKKKWGLPEILIPELSNLDKRLMEAASWVEENRNNIHSSISFCDAIRYYDMGIDVTQIKPK